MSGDTTLQALKRLSYLPDRTDNGNVIAGQEYYDVYFTGGEISGVTISGATIDVDALSINGSSSGATVIQAEAVASGTLTVPSATDTLVGRDTADTLTNKTIDGDDNTIQDIATSSLKTRTGTDDAVVTGTAGIDGNVAQWNTDGDLVDSGIASADILVDADIGVNVQAYSANLDFWATQTSSALNVIKVSSNDTTPGDLEAKLLVSGNILSLSTQNDGGNETRTVTASINSLTAATAATGDLLVIEDIDDSNAQKKITVQGILDLVTTGYRGAVAYNNAVQSIPNNTATALTFNSETIDTDGIHNTVSNTSRLTVPSGVTRVRLYAQISWPNTGADTNRNIQLYKDGSILITAAYPRSQQDCGSATGNDTSHGFVSPVLAVSAGEYFEAYATQNSGGAINAYSGQTWFEMEIIE